MQSCCLIIIESKQLFIASGKKKTKTNTHLNLHCEITDTEIKLVWMFKM